ncbi:MULTISPECIES: DinB family protein [Paenibacillus]|uniref:DinB family protein n=1 Tax=Paenibacillus TaxID=44249 RepID=UPI0022B87B85|nr:DinB family protein [Paenibacillus caseinilyticus]MCZ8518505.1 DinB family protein [Paenibacillus caseinilyticus]
MNKDMSHVQDLLFDEMELALSTTCGLIAKIKEDQWEFRPQEGMMSLIELVRHLVQVPALELAILQEKPEEEIRNLAMTIMHLRDAASLSDVMHRGVQELKRYMISLDEKDFLYKTTAPFFAKHHPVAQAKWLIEITTHLFHHRAQMFTYMKQLGLPVSMLDLYGPQSDSWTI